MPEFPSRRSMLLAAFALIVLLLAFAIGRLAYLKSTISLKFDPAVLMLTDFPVNQKTVLTFGIQNPNSFPVQIVGIVSCCGPGGCVEVVNFQPFELIGNEKKTATIEFKSPIRPGPIEASIEIYFSSDTVRRTSLLVCGTAVDANNVLTRD